MSAMPITHPNADPEAHPSDDAMATDNCGEVTIVMEEQIQWPEHVRNPTW